MAQKPDFTSITNEYTYIDVKHCIWYLGETWLSFMPRVYTCLNEAKNWNCMFESGISLRQKFVGAQWYM